jgi:hypothetical protein
LSNGRTSELCLAQQKKGAIPYKAIHYALNKFNRRISYTHLGVDGSRPKDERLSLGAFFSVYALLRASQVCFEMEDASSDFGAIQAVSESAGMRVCQTDYDSEYDRSSFKKIYSRFERLTTLYGLCIGQNDTYARESERGELIVFVFLTDQNENICTMGFSRSDNEFSFEYTQGDKNQAPLRLMSDVSQLVFMMKWFETLILKYLLDDGDSLKELVLAQKENTPRPEVLHESSEYSIDFDDNLMDELFIEHAACKPKCLDPDDLDEIFANKFGAFTELARIVRENIVDDDGNMNKSDLDAIVDALIEYNYVFKYIFSESSRSYKFSASDFQDALDTIDFETKFSPKLEDD